MATVCIIDFLAWAALNGVFFTAAPHVAEMAVPFMFLQGWICGVSVGALTEEVARGHRR
jgi:hypothetical protein